MMNGSEYTENYSDQPHDCLLTKVVTLSCRVMQKFHNFENSTSLTHLPMTTMMMGFMTISRLSESLKTKLSEFTVLAMSDSKRNPVTFGHAVYN